VHRTAAGRTRDRGEGATGRPIRAWGAAYRAVAGKTRDVGRGEGATDRPIRARGPGPGQVPAFLAGRGPRGVATARTRGTITEDDIRAYYRRLISDPASVIGALLPSLPPLDELLMRAPGAPVGSSEFTLGGASEGLAGGAGESAPELPLEVSTDLIVRGRTAPGAVLTFNGSPVVLNADGTFEVRLDLFPGRTGIDVAARSADGALAKRLTTAVLRSPASAA
jgi:hypothetical protein